MNEPRIEYGFCPDKCCITIMGDTGVIILPVSKIQEIASVIATHQNSVNEPHITINKN